MRREHRFNNCLCMMSHMTFIPVKQTAIRTHRRPLIPTYYNTSFLYSSDDPLSPLSLALQVCEKRTHSSKHHILCAKNTHRPRRAASNTCYVLRVYVYVDRNEPAKNNSPPVHRNAKFVNKHLNRTAAAAAAGAAAGVATFATPKAFRKKLEHAGVCALLYR